MTLARAIRNSVRSVIGDASYTRLWEWRQGQLRKAKIRHLRSAGGVIHIGANVGQERDRYQSFKLDVVWVEPIPAVYNTLSAHIAGYPKQRAYQYLVTDEDGRDYQFHVANNEGQSSSILSLAKHRDMFPDVSYSDCIELKSITLTSLVEREHLPLDKYRVLVLDTQGSELMVLKGAAPILSNFRFIQTEVADFEAYGGCCRVAELEAFLLGHGFREHRRDVLKSVAGLGAYFEIVYRRVK